MDLRRPFRVITPTIDGDVLALLAAGELRLTGREIGRRIGASQDGVRKVLARLERQGILHREAAGRAHLYSLNREHLAAAAIEQLATLRLELIRRLRAQIQAWKVHPAAATLFGSTARGDSDADSDIDILVVRPTATDADDPSWRRQLSRLQSFASTLTGNDARIIEYSEVEVLQLHGERVIADASVDGVDLFGSLRLLRAKNSLRWHWNRARRGKAGA